MLITRLQTISVFPLSTLFLFFGTNCDNTTDHSKAQVHADSIKGSSGAKIDTPVFGVIKMLSYFRRNALGHVDPQVEIDKDYVIKIFSDTDRLWNSIGSINPVDMAQNAYGTFFIVKLNCGAGGECEEYYLIGYGTKNKPVRPEHIGDLMADEDFSQTFVYRIAGDSAVVVDTENYDSGKLKNSSVIRYSLVIKEDRLISPQKKDTLIKPRKSDSQ
jgi:hypothetical protein